jgi:hypothetical protein
LLTSHQHATLNTSIDLDGNTAHCEPYLLFAARWKESGNALLFGGRYIDRLEKRDGRWAISARVAFVEWSNDESSAKLPGLMAHLNVTQDRSDISYERPLTIRRDDMLIEEESERSPGRSAAPRTSPEPPTSLRCIPATRLETPPPG